MENTLNGEKSKKTQIIIIQIEKTLDSIYLS